MKKQFLHEEHCRNDKGLKGDYREEFASHPSDVKSWTGFRPPSGDTILRNERERRNAGRKEALLKEVHSWFYVYGRWLFQHTTKLSYFAELNANHAKPTDPKLEVAFKTCQKNWASDYPKILRAIKQARFVIPKVSPRWLGKHFEFLDWHLPADVIVDEVSRKLPAAFKRKSTTKPKVENKTS